MVRMVKLCILYLWLWGSLCGAEVFFIATSDLHGRVDRLAFLAPVLRNYPDAVKVDAGDLFQGNYAVNESGGFPVIDALNSLEFDLIVLGNHDFEYPLNTMKGWQSRFSGTILGGQWHYRGLELPGFAVVERSGFRIGVIALGDVGMKKRTVFIPDLSCIDEAAAVRNAVEELKKQKCDAFILLCHISVANFGTLNKVVREVPEIDAVVGAHSHKAASGNMINRTLAVQPEAYAGSAVLLRLNFDSEKKLRFIRSEQLRPGNEEDPAISAIARNAEKKYAVSGQEVLAEFLDIDHFGMMAAEAIRRAAGSDAAFFRFHSKNFSCRMTEMGLFDLLPFGNRIVKITADKEAVLKFINRRRRKKNAFYRVGNFSKDKLSIAVSDYFFLQEKDLHRFEAREIGIFERDVIRNALKSGEYREFMPE